MDDSEQRDFLGDIIRFSRRCAAVIVIFAFASYGLAYYVWTLGQSLGAIVIATMGFFVFRSLRKIVFNLTWQHFNNRSEYHLYIQQLDSSVLTQRERDIRAHFANNISIKETPS